MLQFFFFWLLQEIGKEVAEEAEIRVTSTRKRKAKIILD